MHALALPLAAAVAGFVLAVDQGAKRAARSRARALPAPPPLVGVVDELHRGGLVGASPARRALGAAWLVLCAAALGAIAGHDVIFALGAALALGGAASNHLDRLRLHGVANCFRLRGRVAFNLADLAIAGGLALAMLRCAQLSG